MLAFYISANHGYVSFEFFNTSHEVRRFRLHLYELTFWWVGLPCARRLLETSHQILVANTFIIWRHCCMAKDADNTCILKQNMISFPNPNVVLVLKPAQTQLSRPDMSAVNVSANRRNVKGWHLFQTWHITSHDMRISWLSYWEMEEMVLGLSQATRLQGNVK